MSRQCPNCRSSVTDFKIIYGVILKECSICCNEININNNNSESKYVASLSCGHCFCNICADRIINPHPDDGAYDVSLFEPTNDNQIFITFNEQRRDPISPYNIHDRQTAFLMIICNYMNGIYTNIYNYIPQNALTTVKCNNVTIKDGLWYPIDNRTWKLYFLQQSSNNRKIMYPHKVYNRKPFINYLPPNTLSYYTPNGWIAKLINDTNDCPELYYWIPNPLNRRSINGHWIKRN
jgi:hypothetical protein